MNSESTFTLYKRASTGKIVEWTIEVRDDQYRTIAGYHQGALVTSQWTTAEPKNVGKSNETTGAQQALLEANSKISKKKEEGYTEFIKNIDSAKSAAWLEPMLAYEISKKPKALKNGDEVIIQPKLDGMRCVITIEGMFSRKGKPIESCPHILDDAMKLLAKLPDGARLDGELYNHDFREDFNGLISLVKKSTPLPEEHQPLVQYHLYDIDLPDLNYAARIALLEKHVDPILSPSLRVISWIADTVDDSFQERLTAAQVAHLEDGYEGAMVRVVLSAYQNKRTADLLKVKTFQDDEFVIEEVLEGKGNRSGMAGKLVVKLPNGGTCESGIAGGVKFYQWLWDNRLNLLGKKATVKFFGYTPDGKLRFPVTKEVDRTDIW